MKYLSLDGLQYLWTKLKARLTRIESQIPSFIADIEVNPNTAAMELWSQNLNTVTVSGLYNAMTCTNAKYQYSTLLVIGYYLDNYCTQIQTDVTTGAIATRTEINGTWTQWREIDLTAFYTKAESDAALLTKANTSDVEPLAALPYQAGDTIAGAVVNTAGYVTAKGFRVAGQIPLTRPAMPGLVFEVDWERTSMKAWQNSDGTKTLFEATFIGSNNDAGNVTKYGHAGTGQGYINLNYIGLKYAGGEWENARGTLSWFTYNDFGLAFAIEVPGQGLDGQTYTNPDTGNTITYAPFPGAINNAPCGLSMRVYGTFRAVEG